MTAQLTPLPIFRSWDNLGLPLVGGKLNTYVAGTTTPQATYTDSTQGTPNTNPVILNFRGEAFVWLDPTLTYKFVLTDAFNNLIWTEDNIPGGFTPSSIVSSLIPTPTNTLTLGSVSKSWANAYLGPSNVPVLDSVSGNIGYYARTPAEITATVTPVNFSYAPGDLRRYGADPTGVADSSAALTAAIAANDDVFDGYGGGGVYLFASTVVLKSVLRIRGATKTITGTTTRGTTFILGAGAGSSAPLLRATAFVSDVEIEHITFTWANFTLAQRAIQFDFDCRSSRIHDCAFIGSAVNTTQSIGINFVGSGTFTGDVTVDKNYFTALQIGIAMAGSCSTVRILSNEMYSNVVIPNSTGINNVSTGGGGLVIAFNTFETWNQAINSTSGGICQIKNYFEGDVTWDMNWGSSTNNSSFGDFCTGAPLASFLYNNTSANAVVSAFGYFLDSGTIHVYRGLIEGSGSTANGHYLTPTFSAGNFTASGSMTWTVASGNVATYLAYIIGQIMTVEFFISSSTVGGTPSTALIIAIPTVNGANQAKTRLRAPITVINSGTQQTGVAEVLLNGTVINCYVDQTQLTNWTASANSGVIGSISFPIS